MGYPSDYQASIAQTNRVLDFTSQYLSQSAMQLFIPSLTT